MVEIEKNVVDAFFLKKTLHKDFPGIVVNIFPFEYRVVDTGQFGVIEVTNGFLFLFIVSVVIRYFQSHGIKIKSMFGIGGIFKTFAFEVFQQESCGFITVSAMGESGMGEKPDKGFVHLNPLRLFRSISADRSFATLGRDGAWSVGDNESEQYLELIELRFRRLAAQKRNKRCFSEAVVGNQLFQLNACNTVFAVPLSRGRNANDGAVDTRVPRQTYQCVFGNLFASQCGPTQSGPHSGEQRIGRKFAAVGFCIILHKLDKNRMTRFIEAFGQLFSAGVFAVCKKRVFILTGFFQLLCIIKLFTRIVHLAKLEQF